jgi:MOSC domain-containing protein YiiM
MPQSTIPSEAELGIELPFPSFGENLTVSGATEDVVRMGDLFRAGSALLRVTQPRVPCFKLAAHLGQPPSFIRRFLHAGRSGFYLAVVEEGALRAGDAFTLVETDPAQFSVRGALEAAFGAERAER